MLGDKLMTVDLLTTTYRQLYTSTYGELQSEQLVELFKHTQSYLRYMNAR